MEINDKILSKKRLFLIFALFLFLLGSLRYNWVFFHQAPESPSAEQGIVDLTNWNFQHDTLINLHGEWEFYSNVFINPSSNMSNEISSKQFIQVPGNWNKLFSSNEISAYGYGTYRLKILLPDDNRELYGFRFSGITGAAAAFVNGQKIAESGHVNKSQEGAKAVPGPFYSLFDADRKEIDLVIHVSNYEVPFWGE